MNVQEQANSSILSLQPYQPGKPVEELERELGISNAVKLASNENPWGCSPNVSKALKTAIDDVSSYPDANAFYLKQILSQNLKVNQNQITIGNGSNDVLDLLARIFLTSGDEAIYSQYAFLVYPLIIQAVDAQAKVAPAKDFGHDLDAMLSLITEKTKIIFIANPNNPTGTWLNKQEIESFLCKVPSHIIVVLDEAYFEYVDEVDYPNGLDYLSKYTNVVVTRTFSKIYGLAALRVGYAIASESITDLMNRVRQPFNVNNLALTAAQASLDDEQFVTQCKQSNKQALVEFSNFCNQHELFYIESVANFISVNFGDNTNDMYQKLLSKGYIVRPIANYQLKDYLRITMGTETQMKGLQKAILESLR